MGADLKLNRRSWLCAVGLALTGAAVFGQSDAPSEYDVKAAFLYNFSKFVEWPEGAFRGPDAPFVIGVLGSNPFGPTLAKTVAGRSAGNRSVIVRPYTQARDAREAHVLFISASERRRLREIIAELGNAPVLTVGEVEDFCDNGGMINFLLKDDKVRFEVLPEAAAAANLKLSSKLLSVASKVIRARR